MSEYTYTNIFADDPETVREYVHIPGLVRECGSHLYCRSGGDIRDDVRSRLLDEQDSNLMYGYPIDVSLERDDIVGYVLIDRMEDTSNTHETELHKVKAFNGSNKIDQKNITDDISATKTKQYYEQKHDLNPTLTL